MYFILTNRNLVFRCLDWLYISIPITAIMSFKKTQPVYTCAYSKRELKEADDDEWTGITEQSLLRSSVPSSTVDQPKSSQVSLRELAREAYSPSSLHSYKSRPLGHKSRKPMIDQSTSNPRSSARGQPNMKLRMNVLLQKIQQKHS